MPIKFNCHKCGASLRVPEKHIGKKARCPKCDEKCVVPETSQRAEHSVGVGAEFEDIGQFLDQPVAATPVTVPSTRPPAAAPVAAVPVAATPVMAPPAMVPPMPPAAPSGVQSPYAAPIPQQHSRGSAVSGSVVQPLYNARTFIKIFGWAMLIIGVLQFLVMGVQFLALLFAGFQTQGLGGPSRSAGRMVGLMIGSVIGFIFPFIITWIGWQVKSAGSLLTVGVESGDKGKIQKACECLANYFRVMGIIAMIMLGLMALLLLIGLVGLIIGLAGAR